MPKAELLSELEYAECFDTFKKVSSEWKAIKEWLSVDFMPYLEGKTSADVLSIGSGTGDFDIHLIQMLFSKISQINYVAMDPNHNHNLEFKNRYQKSGLKLNSFQIIPQPFGENYPEETFDLIHMTHCLYYIPERKKAILRAYNLLKPQGILLIFHQTAVGINEIQRKYLKLVKGDENEMFSADDLLQLFKEIGLKFNFDVLISDIDVTDCIEENETGNKILNFFLESNLHGIDPYLKKEIKQTLKEKCRYENGRYLLLHPSSIFWIRKDK
jgi:SAM-dependent methyltransferase